MADILVIRAVGCDTSGPLACRRDTLSPGAAMRPEIDLHATKDGWIDAAATVSATTRDPNPANDIATVRFGPR